MDELVNLDGHQVQENAGAKKRNLNDDDQVCRSTRVMMQCCASDEPLPAGRGASSYNVVTGHSASFAHASAATIYIYIYTRKKKKKKENASSSLFPLFCLSLSLFFLVSKDPVRFFFSSFFLYGSSPADVLRLY